jgi:hypothetical protein
MVVGIHLQTTSWLTAKLTANPRDNRGPQWTTLEAMYVLSCADAAGGDRPSSFTRLDLRGQQSPNQPAPIDRTQVAIGLAMLTR